MTSTITLLTDFGLSDAYVGMMKGVILQINPEATIIDLTHDIMPQNLVQAAYVINASYNYFPQNTVHVVVVDPGVGTNRKIIALKKEGQIFLAPDNGVLTLVMDSGNIDQVIQVTNPDYFLKSISRTFHGRDIFAPVAGHISKGLNLEKTGKIIPLKKITQLSIEGPEFPEDNVIFGRIIYVDHFGNLITNIDVKILKKMHCLNDSSNILIKIKNHKISGILQNYGEAEDKSPLALIGSSDHLEIAVNQGHAGHYFQAAAGDIVKVCRIKPP